jgi:hypothetical protein
MCKTSWLHQILQQYRCHNLSAAATTALGMSLNMLVEFGKVR